MHFFKRLLYKIIGRYLVIRFGEYVPDEPSPIYIPSQWVELHKRGRVYLGLYEKNESALVKDYLDPNMDTVELGSGVGVVSSNICKVLTSSARFVGVEGNPNLVLCASKNMLRFESNVPRCIENGIVKGSFSKNRNQKFFIDKDDFQFSSSKGGPNAKEVDVQEVVLSDLLKRHNYGDYQLVSDIEGAELDILKSDAHSLASCKRIVIELHDCGVEGELISIEALRKMIESKGFRLLKNQGQVFAFAK